MAFTATAMKVLIASPSDVQGEREVIPQAIHEWNALNAQATGVVLLPVLWETHSVPEMGGRPQAILNDQVVDDCDILIGAFWTRLGSPTGEAESGTAEEIERFLQSGRRVMLFFSQQPAAPATIDLKQLERLRDFESRCRNEGIVTDYDSLATLSHKVVSALTRFVRDRASDIQPHAPAGPPPPLLDDLLSNYKVQLQLTVARSEAKWQSMDQYAPDEWRWHLTSLSDELTEYQAHIGVFIGDANAALPADLGLLASEARTLSRQQFYLDGGRSVEVFVQSANRLYARLRAITESPWDNYVSRRFPSEDAEPES